MKLGLIAGGLLLLTAVGMIFVGGAPPYITVPPDALWTVAGYTVTNTVLSAWVAILLLLALALYVGPRLSLVPRGFAGGVEAALSGFYGICESVAGPGHTRRFFPLVATIFFFVLTTNMMALLPGTKTVGLAIPDYGQTQAIMKQVDVPLLGSIAYVPFTPETRDVYGGEMLLLPPETAASMHLSPGQFEASSDGSFTGGVRGALRPVHTDVNAPLAIAIFSFLFVEFWGLQTLGLAYLGKFFAFGALKKGPLGAIDVFVGLLELVSEMSRMISFTFRLFGNIFAGSVLMLMMTFLTPFVLILPFYGLEVFVGAIQAFVFAVLTLVFAISAVSHHGDDHDEHGEGHEDAHGDDHAEGHGVQHGEALPAH